MKIAIIGGGAAGFFAAVSAAEHHPDAKVVLLEKTHKLLSKVKVSGGGRCNVTHHCLNHREMAANYPRGHKAMRKLLEQFAVADTIDWFGARGVRLKVEEDNRMFPITDDSQTVIDCLMAAAQKAAVSIKTKANVEQIKPADTGFELLVDGRTEHFTHVIVATGGSPKLAGLLWLEQLGHSIVHPVPSLFTFNMPHNPIVELMGVTVPDAEVRVEGTTLRHSGPVLITHWGMSGPAVLKCSAFGAVELAARDYNFICAVNWLGGAKEHDVKARLAQALPTISGRKVANRNPFDLPNRLWGFLLEKAQIEASKTWNELGKKAINKLVETLVNDRHRVHGKTTFKEEFVTAGGVGLSSVDVKTMQSLHIPRLYFAGEVLDIDGVTGGFNFQAAWTTGWVAGRLQ